jgi:D-3-phosphoglycerate dehydrogenase
VAKAVGVELVELESLLCRSDFVVVLCALTAETRGLLDEQRIACLKPSAFLVNVARGAIIDQSALTRALMERRLAGAALDVFDPEPIVADDPLLDLDNVILTPHAICSTDQCWLDCGRSAVRSILSVRLGHAPTHVVNPEVLEQVSVRDRLRGYAERFAHVPR